MRHRMKKVKLNRSGAHRHGLERNLLRSLFLEEGITTTDVKAKWVRSSAEHLITIAKKGTVDSLRRLIAETGTLEVAKKIVEVAKKLTTRQNGYLRLIKQGIRVGDKAVMSKIEFVWDEVKKPIETESVVKESKDKVVKAKTAKKAVKKE